MALALRAAGYEVRQSTPGGAAARLRRERFDLVIGPAEGLLDQLRLQSLLSLLHVSETLVSETSLATIASATLEHVRRDGNAAAAWLFLEDDASMLEISGETGLEPRQLGDVGRWLLEHCVEGTGPRVLSAADILASGVAPPGPLREASAATRPTPGLTGETVVAWMAQEGWERLLVVPMAVKGRRVGTVIAGGGASTLPSGPLDLRHLSIVAGQTAIAIENARLYSRARMQSLTDPL
ncbi:MAG: GAF domain-containing protein, partial [Chloroflexota bacterium]